MSSNTNVGQRIYQARLAAGLTLAGLGAAIGVTHTAIQKFEKGLLIPSSAQLLKLAQACGIRTEYFFRTSQISLQQPQFRKHSSFGQAAQQALVIKVLNQVEKRAELLAAYAQSPLPVFKLVAGLPRHIADFGQIEAVATQLRSAWRLGMQPIVDLTAILESQGVLVILVDEEHVGFSGLTATAQTTDGHTYPIIAISTKWPGDRQRFTLAHELAHLVFAGRLDASLNPEKACDRFAGAFLAPRETVLALLGARRHEIEWQEIYALKHEFGLSMLAWLCRAKQCEIISDATYLAMLKTFTAKGWRKQEPGQQIAQEASHLFQHLVYRALGERYITDAKAAELLGIPLMAFHKQRQLEQVDGSVN